MPSQFFGLNIAYTGLLASNAALNTTNNNIANTHTEGYSRQRVQQQAYNALRVFQTYGCAGAGVETIAIERVRDEFYDGKYWDNNTKFGEFDMKAYYMKQVEAYFDDNGRNAGFKTVFDQVMVNGIQELMNNPNAATTKAQFVGYAGNLTEYFRGLAGNLEAVQKDVNQEIKLKVDQINTLAGEIATLNKQINTIELGTTGKANELRDRRALLLDQLSEIVDITTQESPIIDANNPERETGGNHFMVKIAGGQLLVDDSEYRGLECVARRDYEKVNQTDIDGLYDVYWEDGQQFNLYNAAMGGNLRGLVEMRDGNNGENFTGTVSDIGTKEVKNDQGNVTAIYDTVTIQVSRAYMQDLNKCNLSDQGGIISLGNQEFYYDSWEYTCSYDENGEAVYSYTFILSDDVTAPPDTPRKNDRRITSDRMNKTANVGASLAYQGIPYYMSQMNEWVRTFAQKFNDILTSGYDSNDQKGIIMFTGDIPLPEPGGKEQFEFLKDYRYDLFASDYQDYLKEVDKYKKEFMDATPPMTEEDALTAARAKIYEEYDKQVDELAAQYMAENPALALEDALDKARSAVAEETGLARAQIYKEYDNEVDKLMAQAVAGGGTFDQVTLDTQRAAAITTLSAATPKVELKVSDDYDSFYRLTAKNFSIFTAMINDPTCMANKYAQGDGVEQNDLLEDLKRLATDKDKMSFRGASAAEFLQCILSDVALNASRANMFQKTFYDIGNTIDTQRISISGVDEDEEAVNLVKYQHAYNLASKMIQVLTEVYDRLILQTGV